MRVRSAGTVSEGRIRIGQETSMAGYVLERRRFGGRGENMRHITGTGAEIEALWQVG